MIGTSPATADCTATVAPSINTSSTSRPCLANIPASCPTHSAADWPPTVNQATLTCTGGPSAAVPPGAAGALAAAAPAGGAVAGAADGAQAPNAINSDSNRDASG